MIYTDYFVKGTQPTTLCPLHPLGAYADALTGVGTPVHADHSIAAGRREPAIDRESDRDERRARRRPIR